MLHPPLQGEGRREAPGWGRMKRRLKKRASISDIDRTLLPFCREHWLKVARVVIETLEAFEKRRSEIVSSAIDARMAALVRNGRLEAKGNIRKWRFSEVRLPP